jgi:hypothetical protein
MDFLNHKKFIMSIIKRSLISFIQLTFFLGILFIFSCGEYKENCKDSQDKGKLFLSDTTKAFLRPYEKKIAVYFKDSLGNEMKCTTEKIVEFSDFFNVESPHKECSKEVTFKAKLESNAISLTSQNKTFNIKLVVSLGFYTYWTRLGMNEYISAEINNDPRFQAIMSQQVIEDNKVINSIVFRAKTVIILGKTYKNVISQNDKCYIQREVGILAFRDLDNRLWVFDRFE